MILEPELLLIPEGETLMGDDDGEPGERPVHPVWTDAFALAKFPVTNREYVCFMDATGHPPTPFMGERAFSAPNQPVVGPSWFDAAAYCEWLSAMTGKRYRLPTEAERERAARGGRVGQKYPWGNELPADCRGGRLTPLEPIGAGTPNGYGLHHMADGVHEWCADWYEESFYEVSPYRNPTGPESGVRRVARGGSWRHEVRFTRCSARSSLPPEKRFSDFGFRVALPR